MHEPHCDHEWQDTGFADLEDCTKCDATRSSITGKVMQRHIVTIAHDDDFLRDIDEVEKQRREQAYQEAKQSSAAARDRILTKKITDFLCEEAWQGRWNPIEHTNIRPLAEHTAAVLLPFIRSKLDVRAD